jgi:HD-GYP domain-containing protein (c-di-GMP phosphodiesterase class II)
VGATLVSQVKGFEQLIPIVRHHHERFDGKGYPDGLTGEEIPLEARIMSVVDVFDALTHERSYRDALSSAEATAELERGAGTQFDPVVLEAFLALAEARGDELTDFAPVAGGNGQPVAARAAGRRKR